MAGIEKNYYHILEGLKEKIRITRQKAALAVNRELLQVYWEIGNAILQQQKEEGWGKKIISRLAKDLKSEFADMKGLSERNLVYMQTFAGTWPHYPFPQPSVALIKSEGIQEETELQLKNEMALFKNAVIQRSINGSTNVFETSVGLEAKFFRENIYQLGLNMHLDGFTKAGTEAFNVYLDLHIELERYKYGIGEKRTNSWQEYLYDHVWTEAEIKAAA